MKKIKAMIFIIIGMVLTGAGIIFTLIGTIKQGDEEFKFQNKIIVASEKNMELSEMLTNQSEVSQKELAKLSNKSIELAEKLSDQSEKSSKELTDLSVKNAELTVKLTELSEKRFRKLTKPEINVLEVELINEDKNSYFVIKAQNTGNNDCLDATLIIDKHNSPLSKTFEITNYKKVPKGVRVDYTIPLFKSKQQFAKVGENEMKMFESEFWDKYLNNEIFIIIFYHFEYEWEGEKLKSSQFLINKKINREVYGSSTETYFK